MTYSTKANKAGRSPSHLFIDSYKHCGTCRMRKPSHGGRYEQIDHMRQKWKCATCCGKVVQ